MKDITYLLKVTKDINIKDLEDNEMLLDSVMFRFIQVSENLKRISEDLRINNPHIPWNQIIGLRNKIVHDYGKIDVSVVFEVLKKRFNNLVI